MIKLKPRACEYSDIFAYTKALEEYIKELEEDNRIKSKQLNDLEHRLYEIFEEIE